MASNIRIISTNDADSATLTSADFVASLPVTNLQIEGRGLVARTTNATGTKTIKGDWTGAHIVAACVLYGCNLTGAATWRVRCWDGANQTGNLMFDSGSVNAIPAIGWGEFGWGLKPWGGTMFDGWARKYAVLWFDPVGALSWQIDIVDAGNPDGYIEANRLLFGAYFTPIVNPEYGLSLEWVDNAEQSRTEGGSLRTSANGVMFREIVFNFAALEQTESTNLLEVARLVGLRDELFISVFPESGGAFERDHSMLCKFVGKLPSSKITSWERYSQDFRLQEA